MEHLKYLVQNEIGYEVQNTQKQFVEHLIKKNQKCQK